MKTSEKTDQVVLSLYAVHKALTNQPKKTRGAVKAGKALMYASLPDILDTVRPMFREVELLPPFHEITDEDGSIGFTVWIMHLNGQWLSFGPMVMPAPADPQQRGSVITYGRRYSLCAVLGIAGDEDDDGASAKVEPATAPSSTDTQRSPGGSGPRKSGGGKADAEGRGGEAAEGSGKSPEAAAPPRITKEQKDVLRDEFGARKALEGARDLYQTEERPIPNIGVLSADEAWELIQELREGGSDEA